MHVTTFQWNLKNLNTIKRKTTIFSHSYKSNLALLHEHVHKHTHPGAWIQKQESPVSYKILSWQDNTFKCWNTENARECNYAHFLSFTLSRSLSLSLLLSQFSSFASDEVLWNLSNNFVTSLFYCCCYCYFFFLLLVVYCLYVYLFFKIKSPKKEK